MHAHEEHTGQGQYTTKRSEEATRAASQMALLLLRGPGISQVSGVRWLPRWRRVGV